MQQDDINLLDFVLEIGLKWLNLVKNCTSWSSIPNNGVLEIHRFYYVRITEPWHLTVPGFTILWQLTAAGAFQSFTGVFQPFKMCQHQFSNFLELTGKSF